MLRKLILITVATVFFACQLLVNPVSALELDEESRTVQYNEQGDEVVISIKEAERGKRLFNDTCAQCHLGGVTKTNPNVGLSLEALERAEPPRDNIAGLIDYMKNPTTYDGEIDIKEIHPNTVRSDILPERRNLTDDDLEAIAAHILSQPKSPRKQWGDGKVYN
uniref:Photosystem II extrinsic protein V n=1 Tax=Aphanothece halophytica TaxID=72020 RepID=CY550_APHHA|nr:RecName: Full=Photosystem II extrinsic protein V; Short=PsbV; AltName: Full=Cytochrome c-550; AltName: Full=Cytochrome c550; AltName: Full=Low-potential cytochrome c; Flags: Precursor [Aphanothece halophytica]BAB69458.1 cytochrome c550 [Aphanothece halophytica]